MTPVPPTILIVEDDPEIRNLATNLFTKEGFDVEVASNAIEMDAVLARHAPDLAILDLMLPGEDGLSICRRLRSQWHFPIMILSAKSEEIDRVIGLEMGADDYLVKPFGTRELIARVRAIMRRGAAFQAPVANRRFGFDIFVLDIDARNLVTQSGDSIPLTSAEFDLLACFIQRPRRVLSRNQILDWMHGRTAGPFDRTVDMLVSRLRRKLETASPGSGLLATVRNGGYLLTVASRQVP